MLISFHTFFSFIFDGESLAPCSYNASFNTWQTMNVRSFAGWCCIRSRIPPDMHHQVCSIFWTIVVSVSWKESLGVRQKSVRFGFSLLSKPGHMPPCAYYLTPPWSERSTDNTYPYGRILLTMLLTGESEAQAACWFRPLGHSGQLIQRPLNWGPVIPG